MTFKIFSITIPLRFRDLDAYGHVNHAEFFTFLETARVRLMGGEFERRMGTGPMILVVNASCHYRKPLMLQENCVVTVQVHNMKHTSFEVEYTVSDMSGDVCATASTRHGCFDPVAKRPTRVPRWFIDLVSDPV
jgi:acyl-CoA thioester hydrolase